MKVRRPMKLAHTVFGSIVLPACFSLVACGADPTVDGTAGSTSAGSGGHATGSGGSGNHPGAGSGNNPSGGSGSGSFAGAGNSPGAGSGNSSFGGAGSFPNGGAGSGFSGGGTGGKANGGAGGKANGGAGGKANGGAGGGGAGGGSAGAPALNCSAPMPTGGTTTTSKDKTGKAAGLDWSLWTNGGPGSITTFSTPAFSASWTNESGDFLARLGLQWNGTKTHAEIGTITAQFASKKTGSGGQYSYIGIYGWTLSPCVEWYIVDDSYNKMPVNPGMTQNMGTADIDGGKYNLYSRSTTGTGGSKCGSSITTWGQFYSIRQTARACGQISISAHFKAWEAAGGTLGKMDQAQILVETGPERADEQGGSIEFSTANVTVTPP